MSHAAQAQALPRGLPEANGIPSAAVREFLKAVNSAELGLHSFMLLRHGQVVAEGWWSPYGPERPHMMFSLSKSFTSTAVGLAAAEGLLSVDDPVVSFFPDKVVRNDAKLQAMRVRHLLSMGSGHGAESLVGDGRGKTDDWVQHILDQPVVYEPGTRFVYNSGATYMLSAIVQRVTGQTVHEYLMPRLFQPLGIEGSAWETCPRGISTGGWGLWLKTEDIAKFGQLYLQRGIWKGERLIPGTWIEQATSAQIANSSVNPDWSQGYGYQFWRCLHGAYRGDGAFGQFCVVLPEQDAVVAITAGSRQLQGILDQVWAHLLPAMGNQSLSADAAAYEELTAELHSLSFPPILSEATSDVVGHVSGRRYSLKDNDRGIRTVSWEWEADVCVFTLQIGERVILVRLGVGQWVEGLVHFEGEPLRAAASCGWSAPDTFVMSMRLVETPFSDTFTCRFSGDGVRIQWEFTRFGAQSTLELEGMRVSD
ncbi:serine hydrolase domain-containing protein [Paenibacillus sp. HJGM_3]|uniref:serine hydrolase domain-containing protein n=1 Tax=Paenibacillus sp. HJGM_3 TaxID=3379816 RepID=UPI00385E8948